MALTGLNTSIIVGNLAADVEVKDVDLGNRTSQVAEAAIYVRHRRHREESFRVDLSIWEGSPGWRVLDYLKKGSLICVYGAMEPSPYITSTSNEPRAGLQINPVDRVELISVKGDEEADEATSEPTEAST
ncbi:MAG: single-stranded DNA-binding protein [Thainema sp.]